jgi:chitin disaccharide deacetylase
MSKIHMQTAADAAGHVEVGARLRGDDLPHENGCRGLLIVDADDWGGWKSATDAALACYKAGRITSVSAMVFMEDSERAAELATNASIDVGLHINFNESFTGRGCPASIARAHDRVRRFLRCNKYAQLVYNPTLRNEFSMVFRAQADEFERLYGRPPSHFDGHQHMHLCTNALLGGVIPAGNRVRRSLSFLPGEKGLFNRAYRSWVNDILRRRYVITDDFFALSQSLGERRWQRVLRLAATTKVELMTHPEQPEEFKWLMSDGYVAATRPLQLCSYAQISR